MINIKLKGCGYVSADTLLTNDELSKYVDTSDEWIQTRTGIKQRYISRNENTSDLAYKAALNAIEDAKMDKNEIDLIIVASATPDYITPSTACIVQEKLGLNGNEVMAFDVNAACSGFLYAMNVAAHMLESCKCALIIGAEVLSKIIDWKDRNTCVLFGDGAGAVILKKESNEKKIEFYAKSIGDVNGILRADGLCFNSPFSENKKDYGYLTMDGKEVFRFAVKAMEDGIRKVLDKVNVSLDEIDLIIPHQANLRIIKNVAKRMKLSEDKFFINLDSFGNTSAASVVIALAQAKSEGIVKPGMKIVLIGFGSGFTYASAYIEL